MAEKKPQSFANHARIVPMYHVVGIGILLLNLLNAVWLLFRGPSFGTLLNLLVAFALMVTLFYSRVFPLKVQDRLIRLEERMRMQEVLPEELRGRIGELREYQLVALRFAPDEELPGLVTEILEGRLKGQKEIKRAIQNWRPDYFRC